jgi:cytidylate kinase
VSSFVSKVKIEACKISGTTKRNGKDKGIVMDGRDIGTVVFPNANLKYL